MNMKISSIIQTFFLLFLLLQESSFSKVSHGSSVLTGNNHINEKSSSAIKKCTKKTQCFFGICIQCKYSAEIGRCRCKKI